jgi:GH24 family phage-related lysozyme (muramidase)
MAFVTGASLILRFVAQREIGVRMASYRKAATWLTVCATFVGGFEGLALKAYPDRLAHNLPTVCYGETEGVRLGDHYTKEQCTEMLANKLPRYWKEIDRRSR